MLYFSYKRISQQQRSMIDPVPGAWFITKFISYAQVVSRTVYAESWPKTPIIHSFIHYKDLYHIAYWLVVLSHDHCNLIGKSTVLHRILIYTVLMQ